MTSDAGKLENIWLKRAKRGPMDPTPRASLVAGRGIEGNANQRGRRQVTILSVETWRDVESALGATVPPESRRANLFVSGLDLRESRGRVLSVGDVRFRVNGETRPCERMDEAFPGLKGVLGRDWSGGCFAEVLDDGDIAVGDPVRWLDE